MEDSISWKEHSFTLLVFVGIVVLCSIFFVLGMLVGRTQGQKMATLAAVDAATKPETGIDAQPKAEQPNLTFFDSVGKKKQPELKLPSRNAASPAPQTVINFQVAALRKSSDAEKLLEDVRNKGFPAFILAPAPGDENPFFRVQVGPFSNTVAAEDARNRLESEGFQPILKK